MESPGSLYLGRPPMTICEEHGDDEFFCRPLHDEVWLAEEEQLKEDLGDEANDPQARLNWALDQIQPHPLKPVKQKYSVRGRPIGPPRGVR